MDVIYDIVHFDWDKDNDMLYALGTNLYVDNYKLACPNERNQFYIHNSKTNNRMRFRLVKDAVEYYTYESETGLLCTVIANYRYKEVAIDWKDININLEELILE